MSILTFCVTWYLIGFFSLIIVNIIGLFNGKDVILLDIVVMILLGVFGPLCPIITIILFLRDFSDGIIIKRRNK